MGQIVRLLVPIAIVALGMMTMAFGFVYHVLFAGLPPQDPPPEVYATYQFHSSVAETILITGAGAFFVGCVAVVLTISYLLISHRRTESAKRIQ
jgi:amino acid transporter